MIIKVEEKFQNYLEKIKTIDWFTWMHRVILLVSAVVINLALQLYHFPFRNGHLSFINPLEIFLNSFCVLAVLLFALYFSTSITIKSIIKFTAGYGIYLFISYFIVATRNLNNSKFKFWNLGKNGFFQTNALMLAICVILLALFLKWLMPRYNSKKLNFLYSIFEDYQSDRSFLTLLFAILISNNSFIMKSMYGDLAIIAPNLSLSRFTSQFSFSSIMVVIVFSIVSFWAVESWEHLKDNQASISLAFFTSIISAIVLNYTLQFGVKENADLLGYFIMPGATVYQIVILTTLLLIPYLVFNRYFSSFLLDVVIGTVISIVNILKNSMRNEPLLITDFSWLKEFNLLLSFINIKMIITLLMVFVVPILLYILFRHRIIKGKIFDNLATRVIISLIIIVFLTTTFSIFKNSKDNKVVEHVPVISKLNNTFNIEWMGFDVNARYKSVVYVWTKQLTTSIMTKPDNYSEEAIHKLAKKYESRAREINKTRSESISDQTVIYVLSESLSDPERVPGVTVNKDVLANIKAIKSQSTSGLMKSDGYGGGTANMEFQALTGLPFYNYSKSISVLYTEVVPKMKYLPSISDSFKSENRYVLHPSGAFNYNRRGIYNELDFSHLIFLNDSDEKFKNPKRIGVSVSDETTFDNVLDKINPKKNQFFSVITMQNHTPWSVGKPDDIAATGKDFTTQQNGSLTEYARLLSYTDTSVRNFIDSLLKINKKITVVFYGDHLPGLYPTSAFKSDPDVQYETDYFIWSNYPTNKRNYGLVNSSDFSAELLEQTNSKVSPYYALLTDVLNNASVNKDKLSKSQQEIADDLKLVQYDITIGKGYLAKDKSFFNVTSSSK